MGISIESAAAASGLHDPALAVATLISWTSTASIGVFMLTRWIMHGGLRRPRTSERDLPRPVIFVHLGLALSGLMLWAAFVASGVDDLAWAAVSLLMPAIGFGVCTVTLWTPYPTYPPGTPGSGDPGRPSGGGVTGYAGGGVSDPPGDHVTGPASGMLAAPAEDVLSRRLTDDVLARALYDDALARRLTEEVLASVHPIPLRPRRKSRGHLSPLIPVAHGAGAVTTILLAVLGAIGGR